MAANLSFKKVDTQTDATDLADVKTIIYEDNTGNKYTFGVDDTSVFNTFRYEPNGNAEVDYSSTATKFMTGGAIATLLGIGTNVDSIKTKTDKITDTLGADVAAIKAKTDKMPDDLETELGKLAKSAELAPLAKTADVTAIKTKTDKITDTLGADVAAIKAKTDKMPDDLETELGKLAKSTDVTEIRAKTDKMPDDLGTELGKLAKSAELAPLAKTADVTAIKTKTDKITDTLGADVAAIKAKTDKIPDDLGTETNRIAGIVTNVDAIKAKTDKMPANLNDKLTELTIIAKALDNNGDVTKAAKTVLGSSFKQAIKDAGQEGSEWLRNEIKEIVSQPSFEIPTDLSSPLSWDW